MNTRNSKITIYGVTLVTLISFVSFLNTMPAGDDWGYAGLLGGVSPELDGWLKLPGSWFGHWLGANGRVPNFLMPPLMMAPNWLRAIICAIFVGLMYWMTILCAGARAQRLKAAILCACVCFALPWWDSLTVFACQTNYVWASVGILVTLYIIINDPKWPLCLAMVLSALGASGHESATIGAGAGVIVWLILNPTEFTVRRRWLLLAALVGAMLPVASPGIWHRAVDSGAADDAFLPLLLKSDLPATLLWIFICISTLRSEWRNKVRKRLISPAGAYAVAAGVCTVISLASGVVGRSGWFGSIFAFISAAILIGKIESDKKYNTALIILIWICIIAQNAYAAMWQIKLYNECEDFKSQYMADPQGRVYLDYTRLDEVPWIVLGKARGVPDVDDLYLLYTFARYHRADNPRPIIIPVQLKNKIISPCTLDNGDIIVNEIPEPVLYEVGYDNDTLFATRKPDGSLWVAQRLDSLWHLSPIIIAPGDRPSFYTYE